MTTEYEAFLGGKFVAHKPSGISSGFTLPAAMFGHQAALTSWALRRGRAAVFADTGLGKMLIELAWADVVNKHTGMPVMIRGVAVRPFVLWKPNDRSRNPCCHRSARQVHRPPKGPLCTRWVRPVYHAVAYWHIHVSPTAMGPKRRAPRYRYRGGFFAPHRC